METKPNSNRIFSLLVLYDMQSKYLDNALDGISDDDAHTRLGTKANHVSWLTGSIVEQRFEMARMLGGKAGTAGQQQVAHDLFKDNKGIQDDLTYPSLDIFKQDWKNITPVLRNTLMHISDEKLNESFEMMPNMKMTYFDLLTFIIYREANIIGQVALWRRLLGYDAMKYM